MEYVYHGSKTSGLKVIEPRVSTHLQNYVYASPSKCVATVFLASGGSDLQYLIGGMGTLESPLYLVERLPGMFEQYFNSSGSLYTLDAKDFSHRGKLWNAEVVADNAQEVLAEEEISDVLASLEEYQKQGLVKLYHYPNRPDNVPLDNSDLIDQYINAYQNGHGRAIESLLRVYPEFTEEVNNRLKPELNRGR